MRTNLYGAIVLAGLMAGCGSDDGDGVAQPGSTIQIAPSAIGHPYNGNSVAAINAGGGFEDFVTVTVLNSNGNPLRDTEVRLFHLGPGSMADVDGNFQPRNFQAEPYVTRTDDFGNVYLYIYTPAFSNIGDTATDFEVFSGSAFEPMTVTLTCTDMNTATANVCD